MAGAGREVAVVEVVGLHPAFDEGPHQRAEGVRVVVDAGEQHRLADERDAGVGEAGECRARGRRQLARVVGVDRHPGRLAAGPERGDEIGGDPLRRDHRHAGVEAHDLDVIDRAEPRHQRRDAARRSDQGIAAGDDHLPDLRMRRRCRRARRRAPRAAGARRRGRPSRGGSRSGNRRRRPGRA